MVFDAGEKMSGVDSVDMSVNLAAPATAGSYRGYWKFRNESGARFGLGSGGTKSWWVDIRVSGNPATSTPAATPTASCTGTSCWNTWINSRYLFSFRYPPGSTIVSQTDTGGRIELPLAPGTNLLEKHLDVGVAEDVSYCKSPESQGPNPMIHTENVTFNGIPFLKETWTEGAMSHRGDFTAYSTVKGNACISLTFWLWSVVPEVVATPPPPFDPAAETAVFTRIMSTYANQ